MCMLLSARRQPLTDIGTQEFLGKGIAHGGLSLFMDRDGETNVEKGKQQILVARSIPHLPPTRLDAYIHILTWMPQASG